jgi:hypothetical protein
MNSKKFIIFLMAISMMSVSALAQEFYDEYYPDDYTGTPIIEEGSFQSELDPYVDDAVMAEEYELQEEEIYYSPDQDYSLEGEEIPVDYYE